jgi:hypothetical protein
MDEYGKGRMGKAALTRRESVWNERTVDIIYLKGNVLECGTTG